MQHLPVSFADGLSVVHIAISASLLLVRDADDSPDPLLTDFPFQEHVLRVL
jgi:hypothetical protein